MELKGKEETSFRWRLNDGLLDNKVILGNVQKTLTDYFELNLNKGVDLNVVWHASKAVIRGFLIQQNSIQRRLREREKEEILKQIIHNEKKLASI